MKTQILYKLLLLAFVCVNVNMVHAKTVTIDGIHYDYNPYGNYMSVTFDEQKPTDYVGDVKIPSEVVYNGKTCPVKYIGQLAFYGCTYVTSVSLPSTIEKIFDRAFYSCTGLKKINIPSSTIEIGSCVFQNCTSLTSCTGLGYSKVTTIGDFAFAQCEQLEEISLPETIQIIGKSAFENASRSTYLYLPESLKKVGDKAFAGIALSDLAIPKNLTSIGENAFSGYACKWIYVDDDNPVYDSRKNCNAVIDTWSNKLIVGCSTSTIPDGIESIAPYAFANCTNLASVVIPESVKSIGNSAFFECRKLNNVVIKGPVTEIENSCFQNCPIANLELPNTIKRIGESAFTGLNVNELVLPADLVYVANNAISSNTIKKLTIPANVKYIGSSAIVLGFSAAEIVCEGDVPVYVAENAFGGSDKRTFTLTIKRTYESNFRNALPWKAFGNVSYLPESTYPEVENVQSLELVDGVVYDYANIRRAETLTYTRKYNSTNWQALYVPFSMSYSDWKNDYEVARINAVRMYDTDEDDVLDLTEIELVKIKDGAIYPNHPYFIRVNGQDKVGTQTLTVNNALVYPAENNSVDCSTVETLYEFIGTYDGVPGTEMVKNKYYALSNGQFCYTTNTNAKLSPNRWYMKITDRGSQVIKTTAHSRIRVRVVGEDSEDELYDENIEDLFDGAEVTSVDSFEAGPTMVDNNNIFTIDGRLVNCEREDLRPGIYVQNKIKFVVR